jgi:hypothetical protein
VRLGRVGVHLRVQPGAIDPIFRFEFLSGDIVVATDKKKFFGVVWLPAVLVNDEETSLRISR